MWISVVTPSGVRRRAAVLHWESPPRSTCPGPCQAMMVNIRRCGFTRRGDTMGKQLDERPPLQRALGAVAGLKAGSWESVEALALLAIEAKGLPECTSLRDAAHTAAAGLKSGTWESVGLSPASRVPIGRSPPDSSAGTAPTPDHGDVTSDDRQPCQRSGQASEYLPMVGAVGDVFKALADSTRRTILDELTERDGQTLFEICAPPGDQARAGLDAAGDLPAPRRPRGRRAGHHPARGPLQVPPHRHRTAGADRRAMAAAVREGGRLT